MPIRLALSLHAADEALRSRDHAGQRPLPAAPTCSPRAGASTSAQARMVFIEYVMLAGVNDRYEQAVALARRARSAKTFKVNLIPYNPTGSATTARAARRSTRSGGARGARRRARPSGSRAAATSTPPAASWPPRRWPRPPERCRADPRRPPSRGPRAGARAPARRPGRTSPLYTVQTVFNPGDPHPVAATTDSVFGIISLIFWSVTIVVTVTYVLLVMRADNDGEGGIMALITLIRAAADAGSGADQAACSRRSGSSARRCSWATA